MATTKIHEITQTIGRAIEYICNPLKTDADELVFTYGCSRETANLEFEMTRTTFDSRTKNLARHLIQSFAPGEVTPEEAHSIGIRLADELLQGEYEYVLSTHVDKGHIHNHIIINEVNFVNGKSFSLEHDRKTNPAWKQVREINDKLCKENNLSIIKNPERGRGKSYYEWMHSKAKTSWKDKLKDTIDDCIMTSDSFGDFLKKMQEHDYEYKLRGDSLSFRAKGQERFTRCRRKSLGWYYEPEQLKARIVRSVHRRNAPIQNRDGFVQINNPSAENIGLQRWAMLKNMQEASEMINRLTELECQTPQDVKEKIFAEHDVRFDIVNKLHAIDEQLAEKRLLLKNIKNYRKTKQINDEYKSLSSFNKKKFLKEHEEELELYSYTKSELKKTYTGNKLPAVASLEDEIETLMKSKSELNEQYDCSVSKIKSLEKTLKQLETYIDKEIEQPNRRKSEELE
jgi:hypothetical protein